MLALSLSPFSTILFLSVLHAIVTLQLLFQQDEHHPVFFRSFSSIRNSHIRRKSTHSHTHLMHSIPERVRVTARLVTHARHFETRSRFGKNNVLLPSVENSVVIPTSIQFLNSDKFFAFFISLSPD